MPRSAASSVVLRGAVAMSVSADNLVSSPSARSACTSSLDGAIAANTVSVVLMRSALMSSTTTAGSSDRFELVPRLISRRTAARRGIRALANPAENANRPVGRDV
jgi:hypothetical protein